MDIVNYQAVQKIAKDTIEYIKTEISPGMSLKEVRRLCEEKLLELGADSFWYYDIGAFVFSGDETTVSVSGREYSTSDRTIAVDDIITIDLSPQISDTWGDYARTVIIQNGKAVRSDDEIKNTEWRAGLETEKKLHKRMTEIVSPEMTFEEMYEIKKDISILISWAISVIPSYVRKRIGFILKKEIGQDLVMFNCLHSNRTSVLAD